MIYCLFFLLVKLSLDKLNNKQIIIFIELPCTLLSVLVKHYIETQNKGLDLDSSGCQVLLINPRLRQLALIPVPA